MAKKKGLDYLIKYDKNGRIYKRFYENGKVIKEKDFLKKSGYDSKKIKNEQIESFFKKELKTTRTLFNHLEKTGGVKTQSELIETYSGVQLRKKKDGSLIYRTEKGKILSKNELAEKLGIQKQQIAFLKYAIEKRGLEISEVSEFLKENSSADLTFNDILKTLKSEKRIMINGELLSKNKAFKKLVEFDTKIAESVFYYTLKVQFDGVYIINLSNDFSESEQTEKGLIDEYDNFFILKS